MTEVRSKCVLFWSACRLHSAGKSHTCFIYFVSPLWWHVFKLLNMFPQTHQHKQRPCLKDCKIVLCILCYFQSLLSTGIITRCLIGLLTFQVPLGSSESRCQRWASLSQQGLRQRLVPTSLHTQRSLGGKGLCHQVLWMLRNWKPSTNLPQKRTRGISRMPDAWHTFSLLSQAVWP